MLIQCDSCAVRKQRRSTKSQHRLDGQAGPSPCDDCVVNVLLSMPPVDGDAGPSVDVHEVGGVPLAEFDEAEQNAITLLADEGLIAPLYPEPRYVPVGAVPGADDRKVG